MTYVTNIQHPQSNEEILPDLRGRSYNKQHEERIKQGCVLFTQSVLAACIAIGVGVGLAHTRIIDNTSQSIASYLLEVTQ
jgi:hypothetical protein